MDHRLGVAKELGADFIMLAKSDEKENETIEKVHSIMGGPPDISIDCCGVESNIRLAILVSNAYFHPAGLSTL